MKKRKEEILEMVWTANEIGQCTRGQIETSGDPRVSPELLDDLIKDGYLTESASEGIKLTPQGTREARRIIRAHRLSERLFTDVLDMPIQSVESNACTFEHILSPDVVDAICTLLGHPRECPHGRPIPPGPCCESSRNEVRPVVIPLSGLKSGSQAKVIYIVTKHHQRLDRLTALGLIPGALVRVHQTAPTYVIKIGETDVALDADIADDIYVRPQKVSVC